MIEGELREDASARTTLTRGAPDSEPLVVKALAAPDGARSTTQQAALGRLRRWIAFDHSGLLRPRLVRQGSGHLLLSYPHLPAGSLQGRLQAGATSTIDLQEFIGEVTRALAFLHLNQFVHGNLKPSNVLFDEDGTLRLTDPLLYRRVTGPDGRPAPAGPYAAPEVRAGKRLTPAADQYSLGLMLFTLISGLPPERMAEAAAVAKKGGGRQPRPVGSLRAPVAMALAQACDPDPGRRFVNVTAFADALLEALGYVVARPPQTMAAPAPLASPPETKRRRRPVLVAALVTALLLSLSLPAFSAASVGDRAFGVTTSQNSDGSLISLSFFGSQLDLPINLSIAGTDPTKTPTAPETEGLEGALEFTATVSGSSGGHPTATASEPADAGPSDGNSPGEPTATSPPADQTTAPEPTDPSTGPSTTPTSTPALSPAPTGTLLEPTATPTNAEPTATATLAEPTAVATNAEPTATATSPPKPTVNSNSCKSEPDHPRYCTPSPGG